MKGLFNAREIIWQLAFAVGGGIVLTIGLIVEPLSIFDHVGWGFVLVLLAGLGSWSEVAIEPYGTLNLSPVVFLTAGAVFGLADALFLAIIAPVCGLVIQRLLSSVKMSPFEALGSAGEAALSLAIAGSWVASSQQRDPLLDLLQLSTLTLAGMFVFRAVRVAATEGVSLGRLMSPLARRAIPHYVVMLMTLPIIWLTFGLIGLPGVVLSVVVLVETYYPWKLLGEQRDLFLKSLQMMSNAVDLKDPYTAHHSRRVADSSVMFARGLGAPEDEVERIRIGALMHDIGKIAVPGKIIRKPSKLTDDEMNLMKSHVSEGVSLIQGLEILQESTDIVRHHHENYDGSGYPDGLAGEAIPLGARIVFVADAFDALATDRPYRKGRSHADAMQVVKANAGRQFDPKVVEVLQKMGDRMRALSRVR